MKKLELSTILEVAAGVAIGILLASFLSGWCAAQGATLTGVDATGRKI